MQLICYILTSTLRHQQPINRVVPTDMYYLLDTVPPIRVVCENVATVNIPPKMATSSVISVKVCLWTVCGCKYIANKLCHSKTN